MMSAPDYDNLRVVLGTAERRGAWPVPRQLDVSVLLGSVELDLGSLPRTRTLTVAAFDAAGTEVADDKLLINAAGHRFRVKLVDPQRRKHYAQSLLARAQVDLPEDGTIDRVEFFLNEERVATLYQPPFTQAW